MTIKVIHLLASGTEIPVRVVPTIQYEDDSDWLDYDEAVDNALSHGDY